MSSRNLWGSGPRSGFLQPDPLGVAADHLYAYARSNPYRFGDPLGLDPKSGHAGGASNWVRAAGLLRIAGGFGEVAVAGLASPAALTGFGAIGVAALATHGIDTAYAGIKDVWTGVSHDTMFSQGLQSVGVGRTYANYVDSAVGIVGTLGAGLSVQASVQAARAAAPAPAYTAATRGTSGLSNLHTRGFRPPAGTRSIPEGIPQGWRIRPTRGKGGVRYYDPQNPGNAARVMPGNPNSPYPNSQAPHVRWQRNGQALDANGNVVLKNSIEAHIPFDDFRFDPSLFK